MSCISGVKAEIAEEMRITENNIPLFGIETTHEQELSKVSICLSNFCRIHAECFKDLDSVSKPFLARGILKQLVQ